MKGYDLGVDDELPETWSRETPDGQTERVMGNELDWPDSHDSPAFCGQLVRSPSHLVRAEWADEQLRASRSLNVIGELHDRRSRRPVPNSEFDATHGANMEASRSDRSPDPESKGTHRRNKDSEERK